MKVAERVFNTEFCSKCISVLGNVVQSTPEIKMTLPVYYRNKQTIPDADIIISDSSARFSAYKALEPKQNLYQLNIRIDGFGLPLS